MVSPKILVFVSQNFGDGATMIVCAIRGSGRYRFAAQSELTFFPRRTSGQYLLVSSQGSLHGIDTSHAFALLSESFGLFQPDWVVLVSP